MSTASFSSAFLVILNIVNVVLGLALTAVSIWFCIEVQYVTNLRNQNHYLLDYRVYWPQAIPWIFMLAGIFILIVSCCGFAGARKKSKGLVAVFATFQGVAIVLLLIAAIVSLVCADTESSNTFIHDAIWDAFNNMKGNRDLESAFGVIEKRYQCCGAGSPRDYKNWRPSFPMSCCDTFYHSWSTGEYMIDCDITNRLPNERLGCTEVASQYARIFIKVFSAAAIFAAFIGILNLVFALTLSRSLKKRPRAPVSLATNESEKVLL